VAGLIEDDISSLKKKKSKLRPSSDPHGGGVVVAPRR
jgi:hypothetical protein